jgi:hypothetical protein
MYSRTIAIYCFLDDLLKVLQHQEDCRAQVTDAEVLTAAVCAMLFFGGNYTLARDFLYSSGLMPRQLSKSQFSRRLARLSDLLHLLFHQLGDALKELNVESRYVVDSFPVPVCDNIRIGRCRLTGDFLNREQFRGLVASKRRYFYGVRVQVLATVEGIPVEFSLLPGALSDLQGLAELPLSLPAGAHVALDAAYTEYLWEDFAAESDDIKLLVTRRSNSKRCDVPALQDYKFWLRHRIETVFGEISKLFPKKIHATNFAGFILKISLFLFAYQIDKAFIQ